MRTIATSVLGAAACMALGLPSLAQEALIPPRGDGMIEAYLARRTAEISSRPIGGAASREHWEAMRPRLKRELYDMLGLWPIPERTPLEAAITGTVERDGIAIEKLHFQSRPGLYVTGNLYRPREVKGKLPAVLYVCGHSGRGRDGNKTAFQDHGMWFARNGYVALLIDTLQLGEVAGVHHGTYNLGRWWWHSAGYTPAGVECWNGIRGIDYLVTRPEVDPARIGVTGISGGGATTFCIAAADERVACAVPTSGMSDLESYVGHRIINGHCDCMFLYNKYQWEWSTIAGLIAPRPMLFANSDHDPIFPMDGNHRVFDRLRKHYAMLGHSDLFAEHVSPGDHAYRPDLRVAIFQWMNTHLKGQPGPVKDAEDPPIDGKRLRAFPEDADLPRDARNAKIDESFVDRATVAPPMTEEFPWWREALLARLRAEVLRSIPDRVPAAQPRASVPATGDVRWLETEPGVEVAFVDCLPEGDPPAQATLLVLNEGQKFEEPVGKDVPGPRASLAPRGVGPTAWVRKSPPNYVERSHVLLGTTVAEGRIRDVAATLRWLAERSGGKTKWRVAGSGEAGVIGAYAALIEPSAAEVILVHPPASHRDGPALLNVLRVLDIPAAAGLLAPRPLTLVGASPDAYQLTRTLYELSGAGNRLTTR
ncbi:MAG: prolyl oligopeptidase family serine peptidase [Isosphaeraceae bacterium]